MAKYDNTNRGSLFRNDKGDNEARPDYTGTLNVEGKEYRVAAWVHEAKFTGKKYLSLYIEAKEEVKGDRPTVEPEKIDDDLPF